MTVKEAEYAFPSTNQQISRIAISQSDVPEISVGIHKGHIVLTPTPTSQIFSTAMRNKICELVGVGRIYDAGGLVVSIKDGYDAFEVSKGLALLLHDEKCINYDEFVRLHKMLGLTDSPTRDSMNDRSI